MLAVITGDIIGSRKIDTHIWLPELKESLSQYGTTPSDWEIYRGDSFQISLKATQALEAILFIKSKLKHFSHLDVRAAIGIGSLSYKAEKITESNGEAFINSGECFENMKSTIGIKTPWEDFNEIFSILFTLGSVLIEKWSPVSSKIISSRLLHPEKTQTELAEILSTTQPLVSDGLSRAHFSEIIKIEAYYKKEISKRC